MSIVVRFTPPYSNKPKDIPVGTMQEAQLLAAWMDGLGATDNKVAIVSISQVEAVLSESTFK